MVWVVFFFFLSFKILFNFSASWGVGPIQGLFSVLCRSLSSPELPFHWTALISFQFFSSWACSAPAHCWLEQFPSCPLALVPLELTCSPEIPRIPSHSPSLCFTPTCSINVFVFVREELVPEGLWPCLGLSEWITVFHLLQGSHSLFNCNEVTFHYIW